MEQVSGPVEHALIAATPGYDLVVVGHRRVSPLSELIRDSVAAAVLEHADGAVAVVPSGCDTSTTPSERLSRCTHRSTTVPSSIRDGEAVLAWTSTELVPGDVIELRLGDIVPADARLLEASRPRV